MPQELTLTDQNFKDEIKQGITLVDFWAPWCGPCQQQGPIIEELAKEVENAKVGKLNVDNNQITAQEFGVMSIPTLIIFKAALYQPVSVIKFQLPIITESI